MGRRYSRRVRASADKRRHQITADDAERIIAAGVKLLGVESQSVAPPDNPVEIHLLLLGVGVTPLEGLALSRVEPGAYILSAFPLNLGKDCDGSPVRAVLIEELG